MSKRTQSIRSMFSGADQSETVDIRRPTLPRVGAGAVKSLKDTFSDVERDYEALREKLSVGQIAIEIDPNLVDPSPLADRFVEQDASSFEALKQSIREHGQEIPVLVREHPTETGRYQSAYGHRRVRATRELGIPVKAYVRGLTDEDLVVAQGVENSAREDLSFIERAMFALKLEGAGFARTTIQTALSIDRAEVSKLIAVARDLPDAVVKAIGRAPKVGRGRWQALVEVLNDANAMRRAMAVIDTASFRVRDTDDRFISLLAAASKGEPEETTRPATKRITSVHGAEIGKVTLNDKQWRLAIDRGRHGGFAEFLATKVPELFEAYEAEARAGKKAGV